MEGYFEDAKSLTRDTSQHAFYILTNSPKDTVYPILPHWHYYIEILFILEGKIKVILNGQTLVLSKGDSLINFPRDVHSISAFDDNYFDYIVLKFDPDILFDSPEKAFGFKNIVPILQPLSPSMKYFASQTNTFDLENRLGALLKLFEQQSYGFELKSKSILLELFYDFLIYLSDHKINLLDSHDYNEDMSSILPAYSFIHDNYQKSITAKEAASYCHLSYSYFSRQFKKISGIPFTKYLNFMRITEAEKLLLLGQLNVTDIGYKVGFSDTSYFIKQFKSFKKMTPKEYVELLKR